MKYISSSVISGVDYNYNTGLLKIKFKNGNVYRYYKVPEHIYIGLLNANSKGEFFNLYIKGVYD